MNVKILLLERLLILPDERLIEIANEIFDYQKAGTTTEDAFVNEMSRIFQISNNRYRKLILLLMKNRIGDFLNMD